MKSYTDIEQSRKLAEILPLESADMCWKLIYDEDHLMSDYGVKLLPYRLYRGRAVPCWSLAGLLEQIPISYKDEGQYCFALINTNPSANPVEWCACYEDSKGNMIMESYAENPVDACVDMIIKLKKFNLL